MIESIVVLCGSKEERQHWIDFLSQDQAVGLVRSPTMPQVSYTHPPFTRLSRYFARLVRKKIIHPELLKRLLYLQYIFKPDLSNVKMRKCLVTYTIYPTPSRASSEIVSSDEKPLREPKPLRKSTLKLDVRYVVDEIPLEVERLQLPPANSVSVAAIGSMQEARDRFAPESSKSLPAKVSPSNCIVPNFDFVSDREDPNESYDLNLCDANAKNWKSIDPCRRAARRAEEAATSPRSSDSGMADSFRHHSSENHSCYSRARCPRTSHSESENDENKFEHQCICTSPFGSTPRESGESEESSPNADKSLLSFKPLTEVCLERDEDDTDEDRPCTGDENLAFFRTTNADDARRKRFTQPIPCDRRDAVRKVHRRRVPVGETQQSPAEPREVFTSGLYAHWWLKKTIPLSETTDQGKLPWHGWFSRFPSDIILFVCYVSFE